MHKKINLESYNELLDIIKGKNEYKFLGAGLWVYPKSKDENQMRIYNACEELRKRGLVYISENSNESALLYL